MADWKRLAKLNGGEPIEPRTPRFDTQDEVWFYSAGHEFRVWSQGALHKMSENVTTLPAPLSGYFTLYKLIGELFVDVEKLIRDKEQAGFLLTRLHLRVSTPSPEPKPGEGELPRPVIPKPAAIAKPTNAYEAVDAAITILKDLHTRIPRGHFLAECLDPETERERISDIEEYDVNFLRIHKHRIGRWRAAEPSAPQTGESSWDYFARVYGSITWIVGLVANDDLHKPFGVWLHKHVSTLAKTVERNLREVN